MGILAVSFTSWPFPLVHEASGGERLKKRLFSANSKGYGLLWLSAAQSITRTSSLFPLVHQTSVGRRP